MEKNTTFHMIYRLFLCEMYHRCYNLICDSRDETPYQSLTPKIQMFRMRRGCYRDASLPPLAGIPAPE